VKTGNTVAVSGEVSL